MSVTRVGFLPKVTNLVQNYVNISRPIVCCQSPVPKLLFFNSSTLRMITTQTNSVGIKDEGILKKLSTKIKFGVEKYKLKADGYRLYECVADKLNYQGYVDELKLPDTFQTWFILTELHVWMLMARVMADPQAGRMIRNCVVEALWQDVAARVKQLGSEHTQAARAQVLELSEQFQASLVSYDEGLQSGDIVLAGAVWRRIFNKTYADPYHLECMVRYIRKTMYELDKADLHSVILKRKFEWMPVNEVFGKPV